MVDISSYLPSLSGWTKRQRHLAYTLAVIVLGGFILSYHFGFSTGSRASAYPYRYPPSPPIQFEPLPADYAPHLPDLQLPPSLMHPELSDLSSRLHAFLQRPILGNSSQSYAYEAEGCPREISDRINNPDQWNGNIDWWYKVDEGKIRQLRAGIAGYLEELVRNGQEIVAKDGETRRGIVMTAGNQDTTARTITSISILRALGCTLPVEVFHYPSEDVNRQARNTLNDLGAKVIAVEGVHRVAGAWKNWQLKGSSIIQSSFNQILYLDSDNIPLSDPTSLFEHSRFLATGAAFWPDITKDHVDNAIWRIIGDQCSFQQWTFESGQILLDKRSQNGLVLTALYIVEYMLKNQDEWFHYAGGDKDTFRWAWRALDIPWTDPGAWMAAVGFLNPFENGNFCGHTTLQFGLDEVTDEKPRPMFMHSNLLKHISMRINRGEVFTHVKHWPHSTYSSTHLNYASTHVTRADYRGFCLDMEWLPIADERLTEAERERWGPELVPVDKWLLPIGQGGEESTSAFDGFEDLFWDHGGRVGGW